MQTVPSLVGTGTAIAAAASGFVFGQTTERDDSPRTRPRPATYTDPRPDAQQLPDKNDICAASPTTRPSTSAARLSVKRGESEPLYPSHTLTSSRPPLSRYQRPQSSQITPPKASSRAPSISRQGEPVASIAIAESRESFSSSGSWIRRLSIRPLSQHGSPRSSIGPDSHRSFAFSHGSAAPILSPSLDAAPPSLPPNKLVKRTSSIRYGAPEPASRKRSKSNLPTFRRPATSHQRSATLHQFQPDFEFPAPVATANSSFEFRSGTLPIRNQSPDSEASAAWISFFHSRTASQDHRSVSARLDDFTSTQRSNMPRRICLAGDEHRGVHLVKPRMVSDSSIPAPESTDNTEDTSAMERPGNHSSSAEGRPTSKQLRRSMSETLSTAGNWVSKTSGSIRRPKRGADDRSETNNNMRHVSAPVAYPRQPTPNPAVKTGRVAPAYQGFPERQGYGFDPVGNDSQLLIRKRNNSHPLPPPIRTPTFQGDSSRSGSAGGSSLTMSRPNQPSGSSTSSTAISQLKVAHNDRTLTLGGGSEMDANLISGDDDDTDFRSDTMFDSIGTGASSRVRTVDTPLDSMYDESPPSTAGHGKAKRLSIQEILGKGWDEDNKIMEEDEGNTTPIRTVRPAGSLERQPSWKFGLRPSPKSLSFSANDFGRLSLDDEFDEDWTKDEDFPCNPLSPPSKGSSLNSKAVNPNVRLALASISGNGGTEASDKDGQGERPLSNLFDWSEPSVPDKRDGDRGQSRPKTSYAQQALDPRGGRSAVRKGPTPTHVRSQSVPVVHDASEDTKPAGSKYGTWGLGTKTISEDWDDDFEFGAAEPEVPGNRDSRDLFAVPESIRATQPSVKAHSGQIRELSLFVNDLKRLCRHGRDMDMLNGPYKSLWKEAEGIIALASPDEDDDDDDFVIDHETASSIDSDAFDTEDRCAGNEHMETESDAASLKRLDAALEGREPIMSKTAVIRERQSPRRRSVFSPDDDIFGGNGSSTDVNGLPQGSSRPRTPDRRVTRANDVNGVVRSVMEAMQLQAVTEAARGAGKDKTRMHFDTNSLKVLVKRAGDLRDLLSDAIRRADQLTHSPARTPRRERHPESSPAFTRVFDDPGSSPPRRIQMMPVG